MRQTSKGLPRYVDGVRLREESGELRVDTFVLSGAEDLVPVPGGSAVAFGQLGFVQWYRPRTEGLFARIERHLDADNDFWKVWTKEGLVSYYGTENAAGNDACTIHDPEDHSKVFGWKLWKTVDVFGNYIVYEYERDTVNVDGPHLWEQSYLKSVKWNDFLDGLDQRYLTTVEFVYGTRPDPFSEYHAGFEVRTVRRCEEIRVLHHPTLTGGSLNTLVKTYKLTYLDERVAAGEVSAELLPLNGVSLLARVQVFGHDGSAEEALPPLDFGYSTFEPLKRDFRAVGGENLPAFSLAQPDMELVDLFGRGLPDVVQLNGTARYWRNLGDGNFALPRQFRDGPVGVHLGDPNVSLIDANGNGTADLMVQKAGISGYYPMRFNGEWEERAFVKHKTVPTFSLNDPEVKLLDLDGDGVTDVLRNGSRFELFFNDRELGFHELKVVNRGAIEDFPEVSFSDARVRIANFCGGLPAIAMIYQGRIDYWPHMGRGKWGKRVTMKHSPRFPDRFNPAHVIVGDLDGDGFDDVVYLEHDQITVWINQSGNGFSEPFVVKGTPPISDRDAVRIVDILGTGCPGLLWSGELRVERGELGRMRFLDLCGGQKPYLLHEMANNLGARTRVEYLPSTHYYHLDYVKLATRWITALPFPVLCVARVEVFDEISLGKLTTEYSYHHGYWDGEEREFRGFGRVDQRDTETFQRYNSPGLLNTGAGSQVAPVHFSPPTETRTWFHLGAIVKTTSTGNVSLYDDWQEADFSAEYWQGDLNKLSRPTSMVNFLKRLPAKRRREALRTLRGSILRSELYALDGTSRQDRPYTVSENQTGVAQVVYLDDDSYQLSFDGSVTGAALPVDLGKYWLFFPHGLSSRSSSWERGVEPMTSLSFQGDYDAYGNGRKTVSIAVPYDRKLDWTQTVGSCDEIYLATYSESELVHRDEPSHYLIGKPVQARTYEVLNNGTESVFAIANAVLDGTWTDLKLFGWVRNYYDGDVTEAFVGEDGGTLGVLGDYGVVVRTETMVLDSGVLDDAYGTTPHIYLTDATPNYSGTDYPAGFQSIAPHAGYVTLDVTVAMVTTTYYFAQARMKFDFHDSLVSDPRGLLLVSRDPFDNDTSVTYDDYVLFPVSVVDAVGNLVGAEYDYRVLQPFLVTDPNGNRAQMAFSPLGLPYKSLRMGKATESLGDTLTHPGTLFEYDLLAFFSTGAPAWVRSTVREHHKNGPNGGDDSTLVKVEYTDGFGRLLQTRTQAETILFGGNQFGDSGLPMTIALGNADAIGVENTSGSVNVVVSGWQGYNNKGAVVEKWEPYFDVGWDFDAPTSTPAGAKVTQFYDPLGRVLRTLNPDATEQRVLFGVPGTVSSPVLSSVGSFEPTPWQNYSYDANDLAPLTHPMDATVPSIHHHTPRSVKVDALGRTVETIDRNHDGTNPEEVVMTFVFDIRGNTLQVDDAIKNAPGSSRTASAFLHVYDYANKPLKTTHIEKGTSTVVMNAAGLPVEMRDAKGAWVLNAYDALLRPTDIWAQDVAGENLTLRQHIMYGEPEGDALNFLGKPYKHYDEAGMVEFYGYDFKGNLVEKNRKVIKDAKILDVFDPAPSNWEVPVFRVDWTGLDEGDMLEADDYETAYEYDALNRATKVTLPLDLDAERKEVEAAFNRAGALASIQLDSVAYVEHIAYNAKGQRLLVAYGNGIMTRYAYDIDTFRLMRQRSEGFAHSLSGNTHTYAHQSGTLRQDNEYLYDLAGNIVRMKDGRNDAGAGGSSGSTRDFAYDPLYRLLHETGRESTNYMQYADPSQVGNVNNGVGNTRGYNRYYVYDRLGNMLQLRHVAAGNTFNRDFNAYNSTSNPNSYEAGNLATEIDFGGTTVNYTYDANGNQVSEGSSRHMEWEFGDRMRSYYTQAGTSEPSVYAHYLYGADGARVKKLVRKSTGNAEVSVYIDGGFEYLYELDGTTRDEEMNEIHVMDGRSRIARSQVYGGTYGGSQVNPVLYNVEDHLGNSSFTVTDLGGEYSQEEYFAFGETSFGCHARKRYRFCGKERDEESGLYYYGARYYAAWGCRFVSVDPLAGKYPFYTPYQYAGNQPIVAIDLDGLEPTYPLSIKDWVTAYQDGSSERISALNEKYFGGEPGNGAVGFDVALPVQKFYEMQAWTRAKLKSADSEHKDQMLGYQGNCSYDCLQVAMAGYSIITGDYSFRSLPGESFGDVMDKWCVQGTAGDEYKVTFGYFKGKTGERKHTNGLVRPDYLENSAGKWMLEQANGELGFHFFAVSLAEGHHSLIVTMMVRKDGAPIFWNSDQVVDNSPGYDNRIHPQTGSYSIDPVSGPKVGVDGMDDLILFRVRNFCTDGDLAVNPDAKPIQPKIKDENGKETTKVHGINTYIRKITPQK